MLPGLGAATTHILTKVSWLFLVRESVGLVHGISKQPCNLLSVRRLSGQSPACCLLSCGPHVIPQPGRTSGHQAGTEPPWPRMPKIRGGLRGDRFAWPMQASPMTRALSKVGGRRNRNTSWWPPCDAGRLTAAADATRGGVAAWPDCQPSRPTAKGAVIARGEQAWVVVAATP